MTKAQSFMTATVILSAIRTRIIWRDIITMPTASTVTDSCMTERNRKKNRIRRSCITAREKAIFWKTPG